MSEHPTDLAPEKSSEQSPRRSPMRGVLIDVAPALVAYYGLRALGTPEYAALLTATILAGLKVIYDVVRARRLDPFAGFLMLSFGLSLAVGLATSDPRLLLAGNSLVSGLGGLVFLGSCVVGRPLTQVVVDRVTPNAADQSTPEDVAFARRLHRKLSAMWGVGLLLGAALHLLIIFSTSVDVANVAGTALSVVSTAIFAAATVLIAKRAYRRREQSSHPEG